MHFKALSTFYLANNRFKVTVARTRFGEVECFASDAADVTDEQVREGITPDTFAQGKLEAVIEAILKRDPIALD